MYIFINNHKYKCVYIYINKQHLCNTYPVAPCVGIFCQIKIKPRPFLGFSGHMIPELKWYSDLGEFCHRGVLLVVNFPVDEGVIYYVSLGSMGRKVYLPT